jgi:hypothetical protein
MIYFYFNALKGSDKVTFSLEQPDSNVPTDDTTIKTNQNLDEIKIFLDARYVSASEAVWRIFGFEIHSQDPHTLRLPVHLEGQQNCLFDDDANLTEFDNKNHDTHLTS